MRIFLVLLIAILIILKTGWQLPLCYLDLAKIALPPRIFAEQTIDGRNQHVLVTRFFHNKVGIFANEFGRCYFNVFDPNFILGTTGVGIVFWYYFVYRLLVARIWVILVIFLALPLLPFYKLPVLPVVIAFKLFAIIGIVLFTLSRKPRS